MSHTPTVRPGRRSLAPRDEQGVVSAEYAVATVAGCGFAAILIQLLTSDWGMGLLRTLFDLITRFIGL